MAEQDPTMAFIDIMRTVFPVIALQPDDQGQAVRPDFFGTAFAVAPQIFMTAAHVARAAAAHGAIAIAGPTGNGRSPIGAARVIEHELFPDHDLAILKCNIRDVTGHLGSLSTIHANSAEQAFTRLAHCVLTANVGLPHRSTREAIALAIHLVVHIARVGSHRRVTELVHDLARTGSRLGLSVGELEAELNTYGRDCSSRRRGQTRAPLPGPRPQ